MEGREGGAAFRRSPSRPMPARLRSLPRHSLSSPALPSARGAQDPRSSRIYLMEPEPHTSWLRQPRARRRVWAAARAPSARCCSLAADEARIKLRKAVAQRHQPMTSQGTPHGRFQRAIHRRHVQAAEMAARERGGLSLADAALALRATREHRPCPGLAYCDEPTVEGAQCWPRPLCRSNPV